MQQRELVHVLNGAVGNHSHAGFFRAVGEDGVSDVVCCGAGVDADVAARRGHQAVDVIGAHAVLSTAEQRGCGEEAGVE